jgi:hypothetical protein
LSQAAYDVLKGKTPDTQVQLVVTVDPRNVIEEWKDNKSDNVKRIDLMYLASQPETRQRSTTRAKYPTTLFNLNTKDSRGNKNFAVGYSLGPVATYRQNKTVPTAMEFDANNDLWAKIFCHQFTVFGKG